MRDVVRSALPRRRPERVDQCRDSPAATQDGPGGWTTPELAAYLRAPKAKPGGASTGRSRAVRLTNALDGTLPVEGGAARADGGRCSAGRHRISSTLLQIVDRYLPDTCSPTADSGVSTATVQGHRLIVEQLRLLHQVTADVLRGRAEHDDHGLVLQQAFLSEKFEKASNGLDLGAPSRVGIEPLGG